VAGPSVGDLTAQIEFIFRCQLFVFENARMVSIFRNPI
jgi:hypothetical protein